MFKTSKLQGDLLCMIPNLPKRQREKSYHINSDFKSHAYNHSLWKAGNLISLGNYLLSPTDWKLSILPFPQWWVSYP